MLSGILENLATLMRKCIFSVLSVGAIPTHIAFILDGNRRYAKDHNLRVGAGHRVGFVTLTTMLKYCCELGVKYVTVYAFSIDNFKRSPEFVHYLMDMMKEKTKELLNVTSVVNRYGVRVQFIGKLELLEEATRAAAENLMIATAKNDRFTLLICMPYTSTDEIVHAVEESYKDKIQEFDSGRNEKDQEFSIKLADLERHMYMAVGPDPDILVRTSGETRLSNFLLWQTSCCHLYSPAVLWPEISLWHLVWAVINFQRIHPYLEKKKKQM